MVTPPSPAELEQLRAALPPFSAVAAPAAELLALNRYYGLEFSAQVPDVVYRAGTVCSGDYHLMVHQWQQPQARANVLLVHGFTDHSGLFHHLVAHGLRRGCNVVIFDLPGHGLSTGPVAEIGDFAEYGEAVAAVMAAQTLPEYPWWALAQSTGCSALMEFAVGGHWPFQATVLLAPLIRPAQWGQVRLAHSLLRHLVRGVPRRLSRNTSDGAFLDVLRCDPLQSSQIPVAWVSALRRWLQRLELADLGVGPALVIQGDDDHTVDWRYNTQHVVELFPGSDVIYLAGAGHQLANESDALRAEYLGRVDAYLTAAGLPVVA